MGIDHRVDVSAATRRNGVTRSSRAASGICFVASAAFILAGCWRSTYEWNQKLTLTISTPKGEASSFAVQSCRAKVGKVPLAGPGVSAGVGCMGEAVALEVDPGRYLFVLLQEDTYGLAARVFDAQLKGTESDSYARYSTLENIRDVGPVPPKNYPLMVTFDDVNNPKSVKKIDPANLAAAFGAGYLFGGLKLEITDEPMTKGAIQQVLHWIPDYKVKQWRLNG